MVHRSLHRECKYVLEFPIEYSTGSNLDPFIRMARPRPRMVLVARCGSLISHSRISGGRLVGRWLCVVVVGDKLNFPFPPSTRRPLLPLLLLPLPCPALQVWLLSNDGRAETYFEYMSLPTFANKLPQWYAGKERGEAQERIYNFMASKGGNNNNNNAVR